MPVKFNRGRSLKALAPEILDVPEARDAFAFQENLTKSQWYSRHVIEAYQLGHLKTLARHAAQQITYYRDRLPIAKIDHATSLAEALSHIPILPRDQLAAAPEAFRSKVLPQGQHCTGEQRSSGSTGQIVRVETTNLHYGWQSALNFRAHLWANHDFTRPIALIRKMGEDAAPPPNGVRHEHWDAPTVIPVRSAASWYLDTTAGLDEMWNWLGDVKPTYVMTYPSIIRELASRASTEKTPFSLLGVTTVGETLDADVRAQTSIALGVEIQDIYSANEIGTISIQCPTSRRYHIQAEALIVEIVGADGQTCKPGEIGRVILTPLFNYSTPLLRYDIGDHAEQGTRCACGRGLPVLNRILGRTRNMLTTPDGRLYWPALSNKIWQKFIPVRKFQLRQITPNRIEVWLVALSKVSQEQEAKVAKILATSLPGPYEFDFHYVDDIAVGPGGKFEQVLNFARPA